MSGKRAGRINGTIKTHSLPSFFPSSFHDDIHGPLSVKNEIRVWLFAISRYKSLTNTSDPSHHLAALSPHDTDSDSNSPILPSTIALFSPPCPKPSLIRGHKSSMPNVEDVSVWLRWAIDPVSALRVLLLPLLLAFPTHFLLLLLRLYLPPYLQPLATANPFTPLFLLWHPTPAPERLSAAVMRLFPTTQLYLKGLGDLALLVYCVAFSLLRLVLSHTLLPALARK
jgi:acyl-CoA-dependent ceramide synthase